MPDKFKALASIAAWVLFIIGLMSFVFAFVLSVLTENELSGIGIVENDSSVEITPIPDHEEIRNNWPNFRGPEGIGIAYNINVPT